MRILALDVGNRRTGVAFLDDAVGIPLPLDTLMHQSMEELLPQIEQILTSRSVDRVIVGLPRLPSGEEGSQAGVSRSVGEKIAAKGYRVDFVDERYSTPRNSAHKNALPTKNLDGDAAAACALLSGKIDI